MALRAFLVMRAILTALRAHLAPDVLLYFPDSILILYIYNVQIFIDIQ